MVWRVLMVEPLVAFSVVAAIMALGFIGDALSKKVLVPSAVMLMALGIVFGPVLRLFPQDLLIGAVSFVAPLTLAFMSFDAGISTDIPVVLGQSKRAVPLSFMGFVFSMLSVGTLLHFALGIRWAYAFLMSSAWSGINITIVSTVFKYVKVQKETHATLTLVSLLDDPIVLVTTFTILNYVLLEQMTVQGIAVELLSSVATAILLGIALGLIWLYVLYYFRGNEFTYTFTLAALFVVYVLTETLGGTGAVAVFMFALFIGNYEGEISALKLRLSVDELSRLKTLIQKFHSELAFMVRSFFFTFVGLIYTWTGFEGLLIGLGCTAVLHAARYTAIRIATFRSPMAADVPAIGFIVGQGAAAAAMSTLPLVYNLPFAQTFTNIALNVILINNITSITLPSVGAWLAKRRQ